MKALWPVARRGLHRVDAERAHNFTVGALARVPLPAPRADNAALRISAFGLDFSNPVGLAAGFDKGGDVNHRVSRLGFGFAESGTLTPKAQPGNPLPRVFRLFEHEAIINRFGFNNPGHAHALQVLRKGDSILGVNIGANKDAEDRIADYVDGVRAFAAKADYLTVNVSSPNTPGLRELQKPEALKDLLARVLDARDAMASVIGRRPILLKISPDLSLSELDDLVKVAKDKKIDGMIVSNTTTSRPLCIQSNEAGGLSGKPLFRLSTRILAQTFLRVDGQFPLIGVGGIDSAAAAWDKIEAGATLVQLYSALVFKGPGLVADIKRGLEKRILANGGFKKAIGIRANLWAAAAA